MCFSIEKMEFREFQGGILAAILKLMEPEPDLMSETKGPSWQLNRLTPNIKPLSMSSVFVFGGSTGQRDCPHLMPAVDEKLRLEKNLTGSTGLRIYLPLAVRNRSQRRPTDRQVRKSGGF